MDMGEKIKTLREERGMTLEQLGDRVGVGKSTVRKWETGIIANMRRDKIALLADALHVTPAYLMGWEDDSGETEQTSQEICSLSDEEQRDAVELYQRYKNAIPEIQEAVERLLAFSRSHTPS